MSWAARRLVLSTTDSESRSLADRGKTLRSNFCNRPLGTSTRTPLDSRVFPPLLSQPRSRTGSLLTFGERRRRTTPKDDPTPSESPVDAELPASIPSTTQSAGPVSGEWRTPRASVVPRRYRPRQRLVMKPLAPLVAHQSSQEFTCARRCAEGPLPSCSRQRAEPRESETPSINRCREQRTAPDSPGPRG